MLELAAVALAFSALSAEQRAIEYLSKEVPRWSAENQCFSCHNNGDGARALYTAIRLQRKVPPEALADTTHWLLDPGRWDANRGNPAISDKKLARIQFAASLAAAADAGFVPEISVLREAAQSLIPYQEADGSWQVDAEVEAGSPATYGPVLATYMARRVLERAGGFEAAIEKANRWLRAREARSILDSAVLALAVSEEPSRRKQLDRIEKAQNGDGGWGPQPRSPSEAFDTAVVLLALRDSGRTEALQRGREFLIQRQLESGGWPETTRPSGAHSYAQHISTSGWATLALVLTDSER
jgi:hypothetical protein